jgi:hypothetical protein
MAVIPIVLKAIVIIPTIPHHPCINFEVLHHLLPSTGLHMIPMINELLPLGTTTTPLALDPVRIHIALHKITSIFAMMRLLQSTWDKLIPIDLDLRLVPESTRRTITETAGKAIMLRTIVARRVVDTAVAPDREWLQIENF